MHWIDYLLLLIPLFAVLYVGFVSRKYMHGVSDFLAAGRVAGRYVISISTGEVAVGLITVVAVIESYYLCGFAVNFWFNLLMPISTLLALTGYCYYRYRETRVLTMGQFLEMRYSRRFRFVASSFQAISGILNYAIFPSVGARFFIYFMDLPHKVTFLGMEISTYALLMVCILSIALSIIFMGGQVSIMVTDCLQGLISYPIYALIVGFIIWRFSLLDEMVPTMANRVKGESFLNPYETYNLRDFNLFYLFVGVVVMIVNRMGMGSSSGYTAAARSPHEQKMGILLGTWRDGFSSIMLILMTVACITYLNHPNFKQEAREVRSQLSCKVADDILKNENRAEVRDLQNQLKAIDPQLTDENGKLIPLSQANNADKLYTNLVAEQVKKSEWDPKNAQKFRTVYSQMLLPSTLKHMLPVGLLGLFCAMMLFMMISTDTTYMHSWGAVLLQDLYLPWRKKQLAQKQHLMGLRISIALVAVIAFLFSLLFEQMDYIMMFMQITGAIWLGGGGTMIVFGLYSRLGNSAGAYASLFTGVSMAICGIIIQQTWPGHIYPWLEAHGWVEAVGNVLETVSKPFHPYVVWKMDAVKFPINSREIMFLAIVLSIVNYILFSLLTFRKPYNLDRLLHRGKYADEKSSKNDNVWTWKNVFSKLIGITGEYTRGDRILAWSVFSWNVIYRFGIIFLLVVIWNLFQPWTTRAWGIYFCWTQVYLVGVIAIISTVWFIWGGSRDIRRLFRDLAARENNPDDNGMVEDNYANKEDK